MGIWDILKFGFCVFVFTYFGLNIFGRSQPAQAPANKGSYSQVGFSYDGDVKDDNQDSDDDEDDDDDMDEEEFNSDDSNDEGMDIIAKEFGVKRYGWLVYMDKRAKEEERRQKEIVKGDPAIVYIISVHLNLKLSI